MKWLSEQIHIDRSHKSENMKMAHLISNSNILRGGKLTLTGQPCCFSFKRPPILLDSGEEGVHVDMKDSPFHGLAQ